jgi:hypothetical protein
VAKQKTSCGGILVCPEGVITDKMSFHVERRDSKSFIYVSKIGSCDFMAVRHAVKAIDFVNETLRLEANDNGDVGFKLSDEQYHQLTNDFINFDDSHRLIITNMQQNLDAVKKLDLNIFKKYLDIQPENENDTGERSGKDIDDDVEIDTDASEITILVDQFINDEIEDSRSFGCVNFPYLYSTFCDWFTRTQDVAPRFEKDLLHKTFDTAFGPSTFCKDGTCGRIYDVNQAIEWTGREVVFEDNVMWNLRVHDGWKGYKLKNHISCELKKKSKKK